MSDNLGGIGWCQNLAHSDHLHMISETCDEPETLYDRLHEMYLEARQSGSMAKLDAKIEALRTEATHRVFRKIVSQYGPLRDDKEID